MHPSTLRLFQLPVELSSLAWSILGHYRDLIQSLHHSASARENLEAIRLAALNSVIGVHEGMDPDDSLPSRFSRLSYQGGVQGSSPTVIASALANLPAGNPNLTSSIQALDQSNLIECLGLIHSMGCYRLPLTINHCTARRQLGAFYTPASVADFIVSLAMDELLHKITKMPKDSMTEELNDLRLLDPACGTGVFLLAAIRKLQDFSKRNGATKELNLGQVAYGVDLDAGALEVAEISLQMLEGRGTFSSQLRQGNSLISGSQLGDYFEDPTSRSPFDWAQEFPSVINPPRNGFNVVLMNPPYERLKPNLAEFLRERLLSGTRDVHTEEYENYKWRMKEDIRFYRESGSYTYSNRHTINTFQLFVEQAVALTRENGRIAFVVPSTILGDVSSEGLRELLFAQNRVSSIYEFPEASSIFDGVTQSVTIMSVEKGGMTEHFLASFDLANLEEALRTKQTRVAMRKLDGIMGDSRKLPRLPTSGWRILESLHAYPQVASIEGLEVWRGELDLTNHKNCIISEPKDMPLIRGSRIKRFKLADSSFTEYVNLPRLDSALQGSKRAHHMHLHRIATQQISNIGQRWRLKAAHIPPSNVLANSCNYLTFTSKSTTRMINLLTGILNSELMNWRFHLASYNNHVSIRELSSLPLVIPKTEREIDVANCIESEVRGILKGKIADTARLESLVFRLYDVSHRNAKAILGMRSTPSEEMSRILSLLGS